MRIRIWDFGFHNPGHFRCKIPNIPDSRDVGFRIPGIPEIPQIPNSRFHGFHVPDARLQEIPGICGIGFF
ncbi:MAG: hypothetical protein IPN69_21260 [Acidobacteria bacterium]|nr:hypothetical protein [Acidobacteriota bacterium]